MIVVDASLAAAWCFPDEHTEWTNQSLLAVRKTGAIAPHLWAYELRNSILTGLRRKRITKPHAEAFLHSVSILPVRLVNPVSYDDVFDLAEQYGLTIYDASYLDLALRERLPLASLDDALVHAAQASGAALFQP
jgi:predicted nucleic acid-binding protein